MTESQKTNQKLDLLIDSLSAKKEETNLSFSHKSVTTSLLVLGLAGIISGSIAIWSNDKDQDNNIKNINEAVMQIQKNQVILGDKFDEFSENQYTDKDHLQNIKPIVNRVDALEVKSQKNYEYIIEMRDEHRVINSKIEIFDMQLQSKKGK